MSHFSVIVIGPDVDKQLAPYHEFECTGVDDEHVKDVDVTEEAREDFAKRTETRLKAPDGTLHNFFDEKGEWRPEFSQPDPNGVGSFSNRRTRFVPEGYEQIEVPASTVESFADFIEGWYGIEPVPLGQEPDKEGKHKYGYILLDESGEVVKAIDRTNPNKQWDWYQVGGRWSGFLKLKDGAAGAWGQKSWTNRDEADDMSSCDVARKGDIDFDGMRDEAGSKAAERWDKAAAAHGGQTWETWEAVRAKHPNNVEAARTEYHAQTAKDAVSKALDHPWDGVDEFLQPREQYIQQARDRAITSYALVKDGQWCAKGEMGWFGMSCDSMTQEAWNRKFNELIDSLPDDTLITVVDCHI